MATELANLKDAIECGDNWIESLENVNLDQMSLEGDGSVAEKITKVLDLIGEISVAA